jgi:4-oxalocrotonate tautomerase
MPIVHVCVWKGLSKGAKRKLIEGMTRVLVDMGIPAQAVEVLIHEVPKEDWGVGGERASDKLRDVHVP